MRFITGLGKRTAVLVTLATVIATALLMLAGCGSVADPGTPLENVVWVADTYQGPAGNEVAVLPNSYIDLVFDDEIAAGNSGVNQYSGGYETDGDTISIGPFALTLMSGPEDLMSQETTFLASLEAAETFEIVDDTLELFDTDGRVAASFTKQAGSAISGFWTVTGYIEGEEAFRSVVIDTTLTAEFAEDGTLSGSGGCNEYSSAYTIDGTDIAIDAIAITESFCESPEGIMEQENAFVASLERSASYEVRGNELILSDEEGLRMVTALRAE